MNIIPLVSAKILINQHFTCDLQYINGTEYDMRFKFTKDKDFEQYATEIHINRKYNFVTKFDGKVYRWVGIISYKSEQDRMIIISHPTVIEVKNDSRKERVLVRDKVFITEIEYDNQSVDLHGKSIPAIVKDISETGILIYTNLDFSLVEKHDNLVTLLFEGDTLKELQQKKVKIKRIFNETSKFFYGCEFNIRDFDDLKQINKLIQFLKRG